MKSPMQLLREVLRDRGTWCGVSTTRDWETVTGRFEHEGLSFLTITLPTYGKELERALDVGELLPSMFPLWRKSKRGHGRFPAFLQEFVERVFDRETGRLLDEPDIDSIQALRQITLMFAKMELPASPKRTRRAMDQFIECEKEVRRANEDRLDEDLTAFIRIGRLLFGDVFMALDREIERHELVPRHGPGSTAERTLGNQKFRHSQWTRRLDSILPLGEYCLPNWRYWEHLQGFDLLEPGDEPPVRVISVPKTLKTPRIIAMEPVHMQYAQQAIARSLVRLLESDGFRFKGLVGILDQTPNQRLAQEGSSQRSLATLDLSEASDRVSNRLVQHLLRPYTHLHDAVDACRTRQADVPGHGVQRLAKFASMGSALTFPIEAMVFSAIVFVGIERELSRKLGEKDIQALLPQVRVYGDDIIVPADMAPAVSKALEAFGLKVNLDKSFWTGRFRESCGRDYYDGVDVSIVRLRTGIPTSPRDAREVISYISFRNQLYKAGYWGVCRYLDKEIRGLIHHFPLVADTSPGLGRFSFLGYDTEGMNTELQRPFVKAYVVRAIPRRDNIPLDGVEALLKWFLKQGEEPFADVKHLERSGRPVAVRIKLRRTVPF